MKQKTQVSIIGAGPAGLTLALLLHRAGIDCVVLEHRSRSYIESRLRAGVLEQSTVDLLETLRVTERLQKESIVQTGVTFSFNGLRHRINFDEYLSSRSLTVYPQQEVIKDLVAACMQRGIYVQFNATVISIEGMERTAPAISYKQDGLVHWLKSDFVAGCDGFFGVSRSQFPKKSYRELHKEYPFSWLGILARASPALNEFIYVYHDQGFALQSLRGPGLSRLYLQVTSDEKIKHWSDERIWNELHTRFTEGNGFVINQGEILQKEIIPMRSFMMDPMQYGRLFLAGDAAHIVPPTGGKGLNLAVADAKRLAFALVHYYETGIDDRLQKYSQDCLDHVWRMQHFSNYIIQVLHKRFERNSFDYYVQKAHFEHIVKSKAQTAVIAEHYVGFH